MGRAEAPARGGFSLVELLVATTILLVIVAMTSMVFQQANGAFQSGTRRVKTQSVMRTVSGAIMRDLSFMVDSDRFPGAPPNSFGNKKISFVASGGQSSVTTADGAGETVVYRPFRCITYDCGDGHFLKRTEATLVQEGGRWKPLAASETQMNSAAEPLNSMWFDTVWPDDPRGSGTVPLRVDIHVEKETTGNATYASARSAGPDGEFDTDDDIWVGEPPFAK